MSEENPKFTITRTFDASRASLWKAWTKPEEMAKWFSPKGFTNGKYKMDLRPGGTYLYSIKSPDGAVMWGKFVYREIKEPEKLEYVNCFSDENAGVTRHPLAPNWPMQWLSTVTFQESGGKTTLVINWEPIDATAEELKAFSAGVPGMNIGWGGTFDQLDNYLKTSLAA